MTASEQKTLEHLRKVCLALPGAEETSGHGHPTFKVKNKTFVILHGPEGEPAIAIKVGIDMAPVFLQDPRFYRTPHVGQHGYISLRAQGKLDWAEIAELVRGSYQLTTNSKKRKR